MIDWTKLKTDSWNATTSPVVKSITQPSTGGTVSAQGTTNQAGGTMPQTQSYEMWNPAEWGQAGDYYRNIMGTQYQNPEIWNQLAGLSTQMGTTGNPVDTNGWYAANAPLYQQAFEDQMKQALEQAGMSGARYSSGTSRNIADMAQRMQMGLAQGQFNAWNTAQENAANRMLQGQNQMYGLGAGQLQGLQNQQQLGMGAAGGLTGIGSNYANLPLQVQAAMSGLAGQSQGMEIDPWTQMMAGLLGTQNAYPTTYQPSTLTQMLGSLGAIPASAWSNLFGGGNSEDPFAFAGHF